MPGTTDPAFAAVLPIFDKLVGRGAGGGALVVRQRGRTVVDAHVGSADRTGRRPWTADTLAISFSTTKGVASTVVHRLADRGLLAYDDPVAQHWPAFAAGGKERITVRDLLTHRAGLSSVQAVAARAEDLLDHELMEERLAARAVDAPTRTSAYHAITYGWLVAGLVRGVTGEGLGTLVDREVCAPLGITGLHIGAPEDVQERMAEPVGSALRHLGSFMRAAGPMVLRPARTRIAIEALHVDGFDQLFEGDRPPIWTTEMPAVNGAFSADALARLYGALAGGGEGLLSAATTDALGRVQVHTADAVLGLKMRWRLGYHHAFAVGRPGPRAFGHYGYGGSGGWADPDLGLSVGFVTNRIGSLSTPMGDLTLPRLNRTIRACAAQAGR